MAILHILSGSFVVNLFFEVVYFIKEIMDIVNILAEELKIEANKIENVIELLDEGSTVAFIARYRKEKTGNLTDVEVRDYKCFRKFR